MNRKTIGAWCLYDFGNSGFAVLFPVMYGSYYFAEKVVGGDRGTAWWGYVSSASMLMVALSAPFIGGVADHTGARKRFLGLYTLLGIAAVSCFTLVEPGMVWLGFVAGVVANFAFEGGIVFYNAYLPEIAPPSHHGRISGRGFAVGYIGSFVALAVAAPLVPWMTGVWIVLALQWALGSIPAFLFLPRDQPTGMGVGAAARLGFAQTLATLRDVAGMRDLRRFLFAYFFYMDGVVTVIVFAGRYALDELHFSAGEVLGLYALVQVTALAGSLLMAGVTDRRGPRYAVRKILLWWIVVVVAAFFATSKPAFWVVAVLAGLGIGSIQASSRAFMSRLIPKGREAEMFGFYALCGKSGAILGPLVFGGMTVLFGSQRPAVLSVAAFYAIGYLLLRRVQLTPAAADPAR